MAALSPIVRATLGAAATSLMVACSGGQSEWLGMAGFNQVFAAPQPAEWPPSTAGAYLVGRFALEAGDVDTAAEQFEQALKADPDNPELRRHLFVLKLADGQFDLQAARDVLEVDGQADEARLLLALAAAKDGDFAAARRAGDEMGERGIGAILAPLIEAWSRYGEGDEAAAIAVLAEGQRNDGFTTLRDYHLAMLRALAGDLPAARAGLDPLVNRTGPTPIRLAVAQAAILARSGDVAAARELLETQLDFFDGQPMLLAALADIDAGRMPALPVDNAVDGLGDALLSLAAALQDQGLDAQAIIYGRLATYLQPDAGDALLVVARSFAVQGNQAQAIRVLDQIPKDSPYAWNARLARAEALAQQERIDAAAAEFRAMAEEQPDRIEPLVALADMLRGEERFAESETAYSAALERLPELRASDWRILYARGIAYERTDRWPAAEADFLRALELQPEQPYVLNYLGYSWVDKGLNLERAQGMLHRAVELRPEDGYIVDSLGWAYFRLGDFEQAVQYLERAVELQPGDPVINDHLGDAYRRVGREREARFQWRRALSLEPEEDAVAEIERKLLQGLTAANPDRG